MRTTSQALRRQDFGRAAIGALLLCVAVGCGRDEPAADTAAPAATAPAAAAQAQAAAQQAAASAELATLSADVLRTRARAAYGESRLYAPAGDNALEYYLALRDKAPGDAGVSSALTDLMPMVVIATEQSRDREDLEEARRLLALLQRVDRTHPATARLTASIEASAAAVERRAEEAELTAEQEAERQRELEVERTRAQAAAQEQAAQQLAAQQAAEQQATTQREAAERAAAERAEQERAAAARPAATTPANTATTPAASSATAPASGGNAASATAPAATAAAPAGDAAPTLRALSTPAPRYPPEALRNGDSGEVVVEFTVNPDGSVGAARVVRATPPRMFDREAVAAVRRWRFEPVEAPVTTRRTIGFRPGG